MIDPPAFERAPDRIEQVDGARVHYFSGGQAHRHEATIASFGEEWRKFGHFSDEDIRIAGDEYFDIVPADLLGPGVRVLDVGCGSGRWSRYLSPKVGHVDAIDPSAAIHHAAKANADLRNVRWSKAGIDEMPFADGTFDLIICLGVIHHVPDTVGALQKIVRKLRPGGHLLLYLYYALDGRGPVYRRLFSVSELLRKGISTLPGPLKRGVSELLAYSIYLPLRTAVRVARRVDGQGRWWPHLPLSYYHNKSMRILRNDALDRFGTPLGLRFDRERVRAMMEQAGLRQIVFSPAAPFWHALGQRHRA